MCDVKSLEINLREVFKLPPYAITFLIDLFNSIQIFDDYADGDEVTREDLNELIYATLFSIPSNPFYRDNNLSLLPVILTMIMKWQASDKAERNGEADEKSYVWRAGYYDVVLQVITICNGPKWTTQNADLVMMLYGEKYEDYIKEFKDA